MRTLAHALSLVVLTGLLAMPGSAQVAGINPHGPLPADLDCVSCHTPDSWTPVKSSPDFDHALTAFPLTGSHTETQCTRCHLDLRFDRPRVPLAECASCHLDVHQAALGQECSSCHSTASFQQVEAVQLHARTEFPLSGAHLQVTCETCHTDDRGGAFSTRDSDCMSCHTADYQRTDVIDHERLGFPTSCQQCHGTLSWRASESFDHARLSDGFGLVGAHVGLECARCHQMPSLEPLWRPANEDDCVTCHVADFDREHGGQGFPTTCLTCHGVDSWDGAGLDHSTLSEGFRLIGRHEGAACSTCHSGPAFGVPFQAADDQDCVACHRTEYDREHPGGGFPTECVQCHSETGWEGAAFDHLQVTGFPLLGEHAAAPCAGCHLIPSTELRFTPRNVDDCVACHQADYDGEHAGTNIPTGCATCHTVDGWGTATFDHLTLSEGFELVGRHQTVSCSACHSGPGGAVPWSPANQNDCVACHRAEYDGEHAGTSIPTDCATCHGTERWSGAVFDHAVAAGGFQLVGAHAGAQCETCHSGPNNTVPWSPAGQDDCVACHQTDYNGEHAGTGFPTTCLSCHSVNTWTGATFNHATVASGFSLVGAHASAQCSTCHSGPNNTVPWSPASQDDCVACHQTDYNAEHAGTGFPTTCLSCHSVNTWTGATFNHATVASGFSLVGAHASAQCSTCHSGPNGAVPWSPANQNDCVSCHQADYNGEHAGTGYPTTCLDCHTQTQWSGATFNHDGAFFPIYSGKHRGKWNNDCSTCHTNPSDYAVFTCLTCHEHSKSKMDDKHKGRSGYSYTSTACLSCHPTGRS